MTENLPVSRQIWIFFSGIPLKVGILECGFKPKSN